MSGRLDGRVALVTGGARGLGRGMVDAFAAAGARVVIGDVGEPDPPLPDRAGAPELVHLDVTDAAGVEETVRAVAAAHGGLHVLVNNAGVAPPPGLLVDTPPAVVDRVLAVNVNGVVNCSRAAIPIMREQGGGRIINTASQLGKYARAEWAIYSASKFAVVGLTQALALEHAPDGIVVNAICPGTFETELVRAAFASSAAGTDETGAELIERYAREEIPFGRMGTLEDIGRLALWLASEECSFTTGASFNLTGGEATFF